MSAVLSADGLSLDLGNQFEWVDEFSWSPVQHSVSYSLSGSAIVEVSQQLSGRPITLQGGEDRAVQPYSTVQQIKAWANSPGKQMSLSLRGETFAVIFRHQDSPALSAVPIFNVTDPDAGIYPFAVTLKLMVI